MFSDSKMTCWFILKRKQENEKQPDGEVDWFDVLKIPKFYCRVKALCDDEDCIVSLKVLHET